MTNSELSVASRPVAGGVPSPYQHRLELPPGWPLTFMLIGFPLWWVLGIAGLVPLFASAVMAVHLFRPGSALRLRVHGGFGWWLLFLGWAASGVFLLQVSAPHAIANHSTTRYVTYAFRYSWYVAATITLIYVYNLRGDSAITRRVIRAFGCLFVSVVVGGILGTLAPNLDFPSALQLVLPTRLIHIQYIHDLIHPVLSQRYSVDGAVNPRASAPFAYTNEWGLNYSCLLPFFLQGWVRDARGGRRVFGVVTLMASAYPVVLTQNRGMWLALVVIGIVIALRAALFGRLRAIGGIALMGVVLIAIALTTPVGASITYRLEHASSNSGRAYLGLLTVDSVAAGSPVVGFGSTRNVEGSVYSIAGGDTATCSLCSPPALGTQGQFWLVIFSTGIGGAVLYLAFLLLNLWRSARRDSALATIALAVILTHLLTMFVYDAIGIELITLFAAIGLLWRDISGAGAEPIGPAGNGSRVVEEREGGTYRTRLSVYTNLIRANSILVVLLAIIGTGLGYVWAAARPAQYSAVTSIAVPRELPYPGFAQFPQTLDTVAGFLETPAVISAVQKSTGLDPDVIRRRLSVTATPNTRVLQVAFTDTTARRAAAGSVAAANGVLAYRLAVLQQWHAAALASLTKEQAALTALLPRFSGSAVTTSLKPLAELIGRTTNQPPTLGSVSHGPVTTRVRGLTLISVVSGFTIGLTIGVLLAFARYISAQRVGNLARRTGFVNGVRVVRHSAFGDAGPRRRRDRSAAEEHARTIELLAAMDVTMAYGIDDARGAGQAITADLRSTRTTSPPSDRVVLVASSRTRLSRVALLSNRSHRNGVSVVGIVMCDDPPRRQSSPAVVDPDGQ